MFSPRGRPDGEHAQGMAAEEGGEGAGSLPQVGQDDAVREASLPRTPEDLPSVVHRHHEHGAGLTTAHADTNSTQ